MLTAPASNFFTMSSDLSWDADLKFGEMVRQALGKPPAALVHEIRTPDVYVGRLQDLPLMLPANVLGRWQSADTPLARVGRPADRCLVMVLESPHVDEYDPTHCYTPWPANGSTGSNIQSRALELAKLFGVPQETGLVLINAIPYQCSQGKAGKDWRLRRDQVFEHAWRQEATRALFRARLKHWVRPRDVLVNACTKGPSCKPALRDLVEAGMTGLFDDTVRRFRLHHPSSWRDAKPLASCLIPYR